MKKYILLCLSLVLAMQALMLLVPQKAYAVTDTVEEDRERRYLVYARKCLVQDVIDEDDELDAGSVSKMYSDLFDDKGRVEEIVVGLDLDTNGVRSCETVVKYALLYLDVGVSNLAEAEKYFIERLTGSKILPDQSININGDEVLEKMRELFADVKKKGDSYDGPNSDLRRRRMFDLVNYCFTSSTTESQPLNEAQGDFKQGENYYYQREKIDWKKEFGVDYGGWIKPNDGTLSNTNPEIGDIELDFTESAVISPSEWKQDNTSESSDFFPIGDDISETKGYLRNGIVDCHFVKDKKDLILADATIENNKVVPEDENKNRIDTPGTVAGGINGISGDDRPTCELTPGSPLGWILCPIINGAAIVADYLLERFIQPALDEVPISSDPDSDIYQAWSGFRIIANIMLIGALLAIVYAQIAGKE